MSLNARFLLYPEHNLCSILYWRYDLSTHKFSKFQLSCSLGFHICPVVVHIETDMELKYLDQQPDLKNLRSSKVARKFGLIQ